MGQPIPDDMDGRVLHDLLAPTWRGEATGSAFAEQAAIDTDIDQDEYILSDQEEAELEARLKGLGYLG
jgi:hypothetical protein